MLLVIQLILSEEALGPAHTQEERIIQGLEYQERVTGRCVRKGKGLL